MICRKMNGSSLKKSWVGVSLILSACSPLFNVGDYEQHQDQTRDSSFIVNQNCPLEFKSNDYCAELVWDKASIRSNVLNSMSLRFWRKSRGLKPTSAHDLGLSPSFHPHVWLWMDMTEGGHSSSPVTLSQSASSLGEFTVDEVVFSMRGKWEIHVDLMDAANSVIESAHVPIWISR
jgi:hypothetical protein